MFGLIVTVILGIAAATTFNDSSASFFLVSLIVIARSLLFAIHSVIMSIAWRHISSFRSTFIHIFQPISYSFIFIFTSICLNEITYMHQFQE